jgi:hypothetical protein
MVDGPVCVCVCVCVCRPLGKPPDTRLYRIKLCHVVRPEDPRLPSCVLDLLFDLEDGDSSSETSVTYYYTTLRHISEDRVFIAVAVFVSC